uniref:Uncharacterized protein n=1 Tax=Eutreptiella gymnastica TaxID=73025 RepID=A0A7S4LNC9_9EUGL
MSGVRLPVNRFQKLLVKALSNRGHPSGRSVRTPLKNHPDTSLLCARALCAGRRGGGGVSGMGGVSSISILLLLLLNEHCGLYPTHIVIGWGNPVLPKVMATAPLQDI